MNSNMVETAGKADTDSPRRTLKVVVIGGSGLIGSKLLAKLREQGFEAVPAAPNTGVNTLTGEGLAEVLEGASVVVDVSNSPSFEDAAVLDFFETSTRNLLAAEARAGVRHHVALSVVGTERLQDSGYFRAKLAQERLIQESSIPFSIVRATQFFEFIKAIGDAATEGGVMRLAPVIFQPIAADDVASALAQVATGTPLNGTLEVAGPEQFRLDELVRRALTAGNDPREVIADPRARYFGATLGERTLLPGEGAKIGATYLSDRLTLRAPQTRPEPESLTVQQLAYRYWQQRGSPDGSPEQDWFRAESELLANRSGKRRTLLPPNLAREAAEASLPCGTRCCRSARALARRSVDVSGNLA